MRRPGESEERSSAGTFPPLRVFLALMAVLVVVGAVVLLAGDDPAPEPTPTHSPSPDFSLTDTEAIARFKELRRRHLDAYRNRDISLLSLVFTGGSEIERTISNEIRRLLRDGVVAKPRYQTRKLSVRANTPTEIQLVETVRFSARFFNEEGKDVTVGRQAEMQVIEWTLQPEDSTWLIDDSQILRSKELAR